MFWLREDFRVTKRGKFWRGCGKSWRGDEREEYDLGKTIRYWPHGTLWRFPDMRRQRDGAEDLIMQKGQRKYGVSWKKIFYGKMGRQFIVGEMEKKMMPICWRIMRVYCRR